MGWTYDPGAEVEPCPTSSGCLEWRSTKSSASGTGAGELAG
jgi:hypothetical protein